MRLGGEVGSTGGRDWGIVAAVGSGIVRATMFKVFLGSTFKDLHEHRAAVQAAINRRDDCKAVVMEEFGRAGGAAEGRCAWRSSGAAISMSG